MKNSDNVVRLGLTPKKKDIPNLMKIIKNNIGRTYAKVEKR
jgi:mannose-6-phosphate isomerase class I